MYKRFAIQFALIGCALLFLFGIAQQYPQRVSAQATTGTIAYVVGNDTTGDQIWLIDSDGNHKRQIYQIGVSDPYGVDYMTSLAWRPDGGELIFTSNHEDYCSWYTYDVYAIQSDGNGYRRVTNGPACAALASYPQGTVTLDTSSVVGYQVYLQGAPTLKSAFGSTLTFDHVADFGNTLQPIAIINGLDRWMSGAVDVKSNQVINGDANAYTTVTDQLGAYNPVWKRDGSRIGYAFGCAEVLGIADHPSAGNYGQPLFDATGTSPCVMAWGPTAATANNIVYFSNTGNAGIYRTTENGGIGTQVIQMQELSMVFRIQYLPDASGFIFTFVDSSISSNIYRYDFQSDTITQLTQFSHEYARDFSLSPDGRYIVFERAPEELLAAFGGASDLYVMDITDVNNLTPSLFVAGGAHPTWSQGVIQSPTTHKLYLPLVVK